MTPPTEPTLEQLALDAVRACLQPDAPLSVRVQALPYVLPRVAPVPATKDTGGKDTGFASVYIVTENDGTTRVLDDDEVAALPGGTVPGTRRPTDT